MINRRFGVFVCGTINSKNRLGGYTGRTTFMAYFDPNAVDTVLTGRLDQDETDPAQSWCDRIYRS